MRWRTMLITIVLNIFVMLFTSILLEYINLTERFTDLENTMQVAIDSAIGVSTGSEEMFSDRYNAIMTSRASKYDSTKLDFSVASTTPIYVDGSWYQVNVYKLAKFYNSYKKFPTSSTEVETLNNIFGSDDDTKAIFEWLYGKAGSDYANPSLAWANKSRTRKEAYADVNFGTRSASSTEYNANFKNFYDNVGLHQHTAGYIKAKTFDGSYELGVLKYPTLMNMGFNWMGEYNKTYSDFTIDNFTSTYHIGKSAGGNGKSLYYLTPASLGVTYIPIEVLKPIFLNNLRNCVLLNRIGGSSTTEGSTDIQDTLNTMEHCITTEVWNSGTNETHKVSSDESIINDGNIEYDLNSAKVKIDYFFVDFENYDKGSVLISKLNGTVSKASTMSYATNTVNYTGAWSEQDTLRATTLNSFLTESKADNISDTSLAGVLNVTAGHRIIARVSVKIKVHVPYKSSVLQHMCNIFSTNPGHYAIKRWDADEGEKTDSDDLWYCYTTYFMQSRT